MAEISYMIGNSFNINRVECKLKDDVIVNKEVQGFNINRVECK